MSQNTALKVFFSMQRFHYKCRQNTKIQKYKITKIQKKCRKLPNHPSFTISPQFVKSRFSRHESDSSLGGFLQCKGSTLPDDRCCMPAQCQCPSISAHKMKTQKHRNREILKFTNLENTQKKIRYKVNALFL